MKTIIVFACLAAFVAAEVNLWQSFKSTNHKTYKSIIEERLRYKIFADNVKEIEAHNAKFEKGLTTYKKAINQFADMTGAEFLAFLRLSGPAQKAPDAKVHQPSGVAAPDSIDWRENGAVTPVKDQGSCGSCWAFSTTGSLEGQNQIQNGKLVSLSEQNLVDCAGSYGNYGCNGGLMTSAFNYIKASGIESEADYPYKGVDGSCQADSSKVVLKVSGYVEPRSNDESALEDAVGNIGPVSVAIDATMNLQFYSSGLFDDSSCSASALNHGVLAVGYGNESGKDYWIVKNSWSTSWGESGYVRFLRGKNLCGIAAMTCYPTL